MKKQVYFKRDDGRLKKAIMLSEDSVCNCGRQTVIIKDKAFDEDDLKRNRIRLFSYDPKTITWGKEAGFDIKLLENKIRSARESASLTQRQVAEALGVAVSHVQAWEYGSRKPNAENLLKLARILGIKAEKLL